jgi:hypothetical protein
MLFGEEHYIRLLYLWINLRLLLLKIDGRSLKVEELFVSKDIDNDLKEPFNK